MSMYKDVCAMNVAFGNAAGNPEKVSAKTLQMQVKSAVVELTSEFEKALAAGDEKQLRDSISDAVVYLMGAYHRAGWDMEVDMRAIYESNMSKFCKDAQELELTLGKYLNLGVTCHAEGEFPNACVKSSIDQWMHEDTKEVYSSPAAASLPGVVFEYPKGKFLKGINYKKPVFVEFKAPKTEQDIIAEMHAERIKREEVRKAKLQQLDKEVANFRAAREQQLFGMPPFDDHKNQMPNTVDEGKLRDLHDDAIFEHVNAHQLANEQFTQPDISGWIKGVDHIPAHRRPKG